MRPSQNLPPPPEYTTFPTTVCDPTRIYPSLPEYSPLFNIYVRAFPNQPPLSQYTPLFYYLRPFSVWGRARYLSVAEASHNTFTSGWGRTIFVSFKPPIPGNEPRNLAWKAASCDAGPTLSRYRVGRPTLYVRGAYYRRVYWLISNGGGRNRPTRWRYTCLLGFSRIISWTCRILAHEENQYRYVYKILGHFSV